MINNLYLIILILIIYLLLFKFRRIIRDKMNWLLCNLQYFFNKSKISNIIVNQVKYKVYNYNLYNSFLLNENNDLFLYNNFKEQFLKAKISNEIKKEESIINSNFKEIISIENFNNLYNPLKIKSSYFDYNASIKSKVKKNNQTTEEIEFNITNLNLNFRILHIYKGKRTNHEFGVICLSGSSSNYLNLTDKNYRDYSQNFPLKFADQNYSVLVPILPSKVNFLNALDLLLRKLNLTLLGFYQIINIILYDYAKNHLSVKKIGYSGISLGSHIPLITISLIKDVHFYYSSCGFKDLHSDLFEDNTSTNPLNFLIYDFYEVFKKYNYFSILSNIFKGKIIIDIGIDDKVTKNWKKSIELITKSKKNILILMHKGGHQFSNDFVFKRSIKYIEENEK